MSEQLRNVLEAALMGAMPAWFVIAVIVDRLNPRSNRFAKDTAP